MGGTGLLTVGAEGEEEDLLLVDVAGGEILETAPCLASLLALSLAHRGRQWINNKPTLRTASFIRIVSPILLLRALPELPSL
jgi:hypothetical protein